MEANAKEEVAERNEGTQSVPEIYFEGVDTYRLCVFGLKSKLEELKNEGTMNDSVAERILNDFMFNVFNQLVKVVYR